MYRKYKIDVHQYVFFIGEGKAKMKRDIEVKNLSFRFDVINMHDFSYELFLNSDKPEEIILADFGEQSSETVIKNLLQKLKGLPIENSIIERTVIQLEVLSKLRKLQLQIIEQLNAMALTYNIEEDVRFQQGQGKEKVKIILNLIKLNLPIEQIMQAAEVSREFVEKIAKEFKK